jgi:flagellar assembly factor FliW
MMKINTTRFGTVAVDAEDIVRFREGLLGLPNCRDWILLGDEENDALAWFQSVDHPEIAMPVVSPRRFVADYQVRLARREIEPLELVSLDEAQALVIVGRSDNVMTLNLKAPLVLNLEKRLGRQVITNGDRPVQYRLERGLPPLKKKTA